MTDLRTGTHLFPIQEVLRVKTHAHISADKK